MTLKIVHVECIKLIITQVDADNYCISILSFSITFNLYILLGIIIMALTDPPINSNSIGLTVLM